MKKYIARTDDPVEILYLMTFLVKYDYSFDYRYSSNSVIVQVPEEREEGFIESMERHTISIHEYCG